jgi:hypothetical protein
MTKKWHMVNRYNLLRVVFGMPQLNYSKARRTNITTLRKMADTMERTRIVQKDVRRITPPALQDLVDLY